MSTNSPAKNAADFLATHEPHIPDCRTIVGFDGFVDAIIHVVKKRLSATEFERYEHIADFGNKIVAAGGLSMNFEFVTQMVKLGGNGPIMANALLAHDLPLTYVGLLGHPNIHPVFEDFARRAQAISIAEPGYTDAVEFADGKLMLGKHQSLANATWQTLTSFLPVEKLIEMFGAARLVAMVNWTMLPHMSDILEKLLELVVPHLAGTERWAFFDLADPSKRTEDDIAAVLRQIIKFEESFRVVLGLNFNEGIQIGRVLGIREPGMEHEAVAAHAAAIRNQLGIHTVVIHPTAFAAAADDTGHQALSGPYTEKPKITTGAGDHFNAGFCLGRMLGAGLETSLQLGVATSGYYVRNAASPTTAQLKDFLSTLDHH